MNKVNGSMIVLAREARGYTQIELAELLNIAQGTLSKIEQGILAPSQEILDALKEKLLYPTTFFEQQDKIYNPDLIYYRRRIRVAKKQILKAEALMNIIRMNVERLLQNVDIPEINIINWDVDENGSPDQAAIFLRQKWGLPKGRIENLTKLAEDKGIIIVELDFGTEKMDGISMFTTANQPIIFVNTNIPGDRQRLTIAHELGHLVLHLGKIIDIGRDEEKEAMKFAGEFLMPAKEFTKNYNNIDLRFLAQQKSYWLTSMAAILYRYKDLEMISDNQYKYLWQQMSALGYKQREPYELNVPKERPALVKEILDIHQQQLGYSKDEIATMLNLFKTDIDNLYNLNPSMRVLRKI
jgi:Zn-dependent peptidase ImmA (M78 family)/DNA-binding XRE family transcriptional regulator